MKTITMIFLTIFLAKGCSNEAQNDIANTTLQYTATTRGFFKKLLLSIKKQPFQEIEMVKNLHKR